MKVLEKLKSIILYLKSNHILNLANQTTAKRVREFSCDACSYCVFITLYKYGLHMMQSLWLRYKVCAWLRNKLMSFLGLCMEIFNTEWLLVTPKASTTANFCWFNILKQVVVEAWRYIKGICSCFIMLTNIHNVLSQKYCVADIFTTLIIADKYKLQSAVSSS